MPILTPEERVGTTIGGKYRIDRILASGGMGTVFAGVHEWTHRGVALKVLNYEHAREPEVVRRFLQEARAAAQLKHANVVDVLDMGQEPDGTVYLVLELLEGETLKACMKRGPLAPSQLVTLLAPVMHALAAAHAKGVVHRDLKPDNIFLALDEAGRLVPKLLDFGIAKVGSGESSSTRTGTMVGTPHFMSPEQVRGERDVGPAADVWSMGVVIYACLAGRLPFDADSAAAVLAKVITERPVPLLAVRPDLPPELGALVDRALQARPSDRFANMSEMLAAFEASRASAPSSRLDAHDASDPHDAAPSELEAVPTVQLDVGTLPQRPQETPFTWTAEPPPAGAPPSRSAMKIVVPIAALAVIGLAGGGGFWLFGRGAPAQSAADQPIDVTSLARPPLPEPAWQPAPEAVPPIAPPVEPPIAEPEPVAQPEPLPVAPAPEPVAPEPVAQPEAVATPEPLVQPEPVATPEPVAQPEPLAQRPPAERPAPAKRSPSRATGPSRGTRGALILR
ncbi:MAG: protein kinase [Sandaracinaceae bacterium]|nr:protein kinase [Sandaracinaceae bacterium]